MWTDTALLDRARRHTAGMTVLPSGTGSHPNLPEIREVLRSAFRLSPTELVLMGCAAHAPDGPHEHGGMPVGMFAHARDIRDRLEARHAGEDPAGVRAAGCAVQGAYLRPWIGQSRHAALTGPFRAVVGPPGEAGLGPQHAAVGLLLSKAAAFGPQDVQTLAESFRTVPPAVRDTISGAVFSAADVAGRLTSLRLVEESAAILVQAVAGARPDDVCDAAGATSLAAGAIIVSDMLPSSVAVSASAAWNACFPAV